MTSPPLKIAPSLLAADASRLGEEVKRVEAAGVDMIHVDVMDGHFVPNLSLGPCVVEGLRRVTTLPLDVHLMIEHPLQYIDAFANAGSDLLTFHIEALDPTAEVIAKIRSRKILVGISLRPATPVKQLEPWLDQVDLVLVMSVNPGFGGQAFMAEVLPKVRALRSRYAKEIQIDGGITETTGQQAVAHGANILVAGTYIFNAPDPRQAVARLRACAG